MSTWILIILLAGNFSGGRAGFSVEFSSEERCVMAAVKVLKSATERGERLIVDCVQK